MLVKKIYYPLTSLGPGIRTGLWTVGCFRNCFNCIAPDLQKPSDKYLMKVEDILLKIKNMNENTPIRMTISGGEPLIQKDLLFLLKGLRKLGADDILLYTGYTYEEILASDKKEVLDYIDVLIDGPYIEELNDNKPLRGSSNQRIIFLNDKYKDEYLAYLKSDRKIQVDPTETDGFDLLGIVPKGFNEGFNQKMAKKGYKVKK